MKLNEWLKSKGIECSRFFYNLSVPHLIETSVKLNEGILGSNGTLIVNTGERTGRSPNDRFIVKDSETEKNIEEISNSIKNISSKIKQTIKTIEFPERSVDSITNFDSAIVQTVKE
ncbi:MAG: phosphoenolpyruvate carboxykinase (ATP), partial [Deltaproteobacteria bacterium]|nr:phosphoenolpyruvate carboxykinase (ATP) [Deltaproteobacteria bacterium]